MDCRPRGDTGEQDSGSSLSRVLALSSLSPPNPTLRQSLEGVLKGANSVRGGECVRVGHVQVSGKSGRAPRTDKEESAALWHFPRRDASPREGRNTKLVCGS